MPKSPVRPWQPDSNKIASGKPGAVHALSRGKPVVRGTRIAVSLVLEELAHNPDVAELLAAHPDLTRADVQACLSYEGDGDGRGGLPKAPEGSKL